MPQLTHLGWVAPNRAVCRLPCLCRCSWGQELLLVGSGEALGNWSVENGRRMHWTDGDVWQVDFEVTAG